MLETTLSASIDRFLTWASVNLSPRTVAVYRLYLRRFLAFAGEVPIGSLTPAMLTTWSRKYHPVQAVQRLTAWLHKEERSIRENPLAGMRKLATGKRLRVLDRREMAALLRASDPCFRAFLVALRETIARPQEVRALRSIDLRAPGNVTADVAAIAAGRAFFQLENGKGFDRRSDRSAERIIPISPRFGRLLCRLLRSARAENVTIFTNQRGKPWTANAVRCRLRRLRMRVGLAADRRGERVVAYTLRHTGATACARAGLRDFTLAAVLGHASVRTTARYVHLQAADVIDAMHRVWEAKTAGRPKTDLPGLRRPRPE